MLLAHPAITQFVARDDAGAIVGVSTLAVFPIPTAKRAWIEDVIVDESVNGQGIGRRLTEAMLDLARGARLQDGRPHQPPHPRSRQRPLQEGRLRTARDQRLPIRPRSLTGPGRRRGYGARHDELEGDRGGRAGLRGTGAAAVRRRSAQDHRDAAGRRLAADLGDRVRVRRRRAPVRVDDRCPQGGGPASRPPVRPPWADLPPGGGQGGGVAGRGEDRGTGGPRRTVSPRRGARGRTASRSSPTSARSSSPASNDAATMLVVESWTPERGLRRVERA